MRELADRELGFTVPDRPGFKKIVELDKVIAQSIGVKSRTSKKVLTIYDDLIKQFGSELHILFDQNLEAMLEKNIEPLLVEGLMRNREGNLHIQPGFDGEYGHVDIFTPEEIESRKPVQSSLF